MSKSTIQLTSLMEITSGAHITYFYNDFGYYLENVASFIAKGIELGQHIILFESNANTLLISDKIKQHYTEENWQKILFLDNTVFYESNDIFHCNRVVQNFEATITPYLEKNTPIRVWGHLVWLDQEDLHHKLQEFECTCDKGIRELGILTICAYNARSTTASVMIAALNTHEYIMTDDKLAKSELYTSTGKSILYPALFLQSNMESEMELYKQKLDFVQVVSHEVRNPLTVIKSYAMMLAKEAMSLNSKHKLNEISDYVDVIDNEIAHIINTEQMLTTESLWVKSTLSPLMALEEVIRISETKARTQGMFLHKEFNLTGHERMSSNLIGFRLIFSNLLSNAIKYSFEAGNVYIKVKVAENRLVIDIIDEGMGMSKDQLSKLFIKYEKTNNERSGQGIGLFMVKKLVDHFEGDISIKSIVEKGTQLQVSLPLLDSSR